MNKVSKTLAAVIAVSLLIPAQAWAAKKNHTEQKYYFDDVQWQQQKLPEMDKLTLQLKDAKKKNIPIQRLPAEMDQELKRIIQLFPELQGVPLNYVDIILRTDDQPELWSFSFWTNDGMDKAIHANIVIEPESKVILEYQYQNPLVKSNTPLSEAKAKKLASVFMKKVLGGVANDYSFKYVIPAVIETEENQENYFTLIGFERLVNKIPYNNPGVYMQMVGERVTHYSCDLETYLVDPALFPDPGDALTKSEARSAYKKLLEMNLLYREKQLFDRNGNETKYKPVLTYEPSYTGAMDAFTGQAMFDPDQLFPQTPEQVNVTPEGRKIFVSSLRQGEKLLKSEFGIDVSEWNITSISTGEDEDGNIFFLEYEWENRPEEDLEESAWFSIEPSTNRVKAFEHYEYRNNNTTVKVSLEEAEQLALATLQKYLQEPMKETQLTLMHSPEDQLTLPDWIDDEQLVGFDQNYYQFRLEETNQGVPIAERVYPVRIDAATGEANYIEFGKDLDEVSLPDNKNTVSPAKAKTSYINNLNFDLLYIWPEYFGQKAPKPVLVYNTSYKSDGYIDAFTGKFVRTKIKQK